jgi:hypothetical protein
MLYCRLIVERYRIMRFLNFLVHFKTSKNVLELFFVAELNHRILFHQKQTWVTNCLGRGQEFAFFFDEFAIFNPWGSWLFVIDTFNHLIKIERNGEFLSTVSISIYDKVIALLVFSPDATLV